jgi:hypothetical protein
MQTDRWLAPRTRSLAVHLSPPRLLTPKPPTRGGSIIRCKISSWATSIFFTIIFNFSFLLSSLRCVFLFSKAGLQQSTGCLNPFLPSDGRINHTAMFFNRTAAALSRPATNPTCITPVPPATCPAWMQAACCNNGMNKYTRLGPANRNNMNCPDRSGCPAPTPQFVTPPGCSCVFRPSSPCPNCRFQCSQQTVTGIIPIVGGLTSNIAGSAPCGCAGFASVSMGTCFPGRPPTPTPCQVNQDCNPACTPTTPGYSAPTCTCPASPATCLPATGPISPNSCNNLCAGSAPSVACTFAPSTPTLPAACLTPTAIPSRCMFLGAGCQQFRPLATQFANRYNNFKLPPSCSCPNSRPDAVGCLFVPAGGSGFYDDQTATCALANPSRSVCDKSGTSCANGQPSASENGCNYVPLAKNACPTGSTRPLCSGTCPSNAPTPACVFTAARPLCTGIPATFIPGANYFYSWNNFGCWDGAMGLGLYCVVVFVMYVYLHLFFKCAIALSCLCRQLRTAIQPFKESYKSDLVRTVMLVNLQIIFVPNSLFISASQYSLDLIVLFFFLNFIFQAPILAQRLGFTRIRWDFVLTTMHSLYLAIH